MKKCFILILIPFISGCCRNSTCPKAEFQQIQDEVSIRTGYLPFWDPTDCNLSELLNTELTADLAGQIALLNNPKLLATYESLGIAKAQLAQAKRLKNPIFSLSYLFSTTTSVTDLIEMGLLQNFLELLLIPLKTKKAKEELEAVKAMITGKILETIAETKIAFFEYLALEEILEIKKQLILALEYSFEAAGKLYEAGNQTELSLAEKKVPYELAKLDLANFEIKFAEAREKLNILMGVCSLDWKAKTGLPCRLIESISANCIEEQSLEKSLNLKKLRHEILKTAAKYGIEKTHIVFPKIEIGPGAEREESIWYVGPSLNIAIPLFDLGDAVSAEGRAEILRMQKEYLDSCVKIRAYARLAYFQFKTAFEQSVFYEETVAPLSQELTHLALLQHNAMQIGVFRLLDAKTKELENKLKGIEALRDYWIYRIKLELILSGQLPSSIIL